MAKQLKITSFFNSPAAGPRPARPTRNVPDGRAEEEENENEVSIIRNDLDDTGNDGDVDDDDDIMVVEPTTATNKTNKAADKVVRPMPVMTLMSDSSDEDDVANDQNKKAKRRKKAPVVDDDESSGGAKGVADEANKTDDDDADAKNNKNPVADDSEATVEFLQEQKPEIKKRPLAELVSTTNDAATDSGEDSDEVQKPRQRAKTCVTASSDTKDAKAAATTTKTPCKIEEDGIIGMKVRSPPNAKAPIQLD